MSRAQQRLGVVVGIVIFLASVASAADAQPVLPGAPRGPMVTAPDGASRAERVAFAPGLGPRLAAIANEGTIRIADWPVSPGQRRTAVLTRHDVYAPGAQVLVAREHGLVPVPRSTLVFLWGAVAEDPEARVMVAVHPDTGALEGMSVTGAGLHELRRDAAGPNHEYLVAPAASFQPTPEPLRWNCGQESLPGVPGQVAGTVASPRGLVFPGSTFASVAPAAPLALRTATIAVDTDNELMLRKFGDDTTAATNYLATLFAGMSVIYERDLGVRTLQGTTVLRPSTTADPYTQNSGSSASGSELSEFGNYWKANYASVKRTVAMMLSGKSTSANSSSGIAWVGGLCSTSYGYSFSKVFLYSGSTGSSDLLVVPHEVGHNFGSPHTHCYSPPIDSCYASESGCYSGATSCPAATTINGLTNVHGTLMSYCHLLNGCSASHVFHPRSVELIAPLVDAQVGKCIDAPAVPPSEASASGELNARRGTGSALTVTYGAACGATGHTVYTGSLDTLRTSGVQWTGRTCGQGTSGSLSFTPGAGNVFFVIVGNDGTTEGSYGQTSAGTERPAAGAGGSCSYTQTLGGHC